MMSVLVLSGTAGIANVGLGEPKALFLASDVFATNGTLLVDGRTLTYENEDLMWAGNIRIVNRGHIVLRNSTFKFVQLASFQYSITIEGSSGISLTDSAFKSKYPVAWTVVDSQVRLVESFAATTRIDALGNSDIASSSSILAGVEIEGNGSVAVSDSALGPISLSGRSAATILRAELSNLGLADESTCVIENSTVGDVILSDSSSIHQSHSNASSIHAWDDSSANVTHSDLAEIEVYDSSVASLLDCVIGSYDVRSSRIQILSSLNIGSLNCAGHSTVSAVNTSVHEIYAGFTTVKLEGCTVDTALFDYGSQAEVLDSNVTTLTSTRGALVNISGVRSSLIECQTSAITRIERTRSEVIDMWNAWGGISTVINSTFTRLTSRWYTPLVINDTVSQFGFFYDGTVVQATNCRFEYYLMAMYDSNLTLDMCYIHELYSRPNCVVELNRCNFSWVIEPELQTHTILCPPIGWTNYFNVLSNGTFDAASFDLTARHSTIQGLSAAVGQGVQCQILSGFLDWVAVGYGGWADFTNCTIRRVDCYTESFTSLNACAIGRLQSNPGSSGAICACNITDVWEVWSDWTALNCQFGFLGARGPSSVELHACSIDGMAWLDSVSQVWMHDCFLQEIRQYDTSFILLNCSVVQIFNCGGPGMRPSCRAVNSTIYGFGGNSDCTVTFVSSRIDHLHAREHSIVTVQDCSVGELVVYGGGHVTIVDQFDRDSEAYYSIQDTAVVERQYQIAVLYQNSTPAGFIYYEVLDLTGTVLLSGTTLSDGTSSFLFRFTVTNSQTFDDSFEIRVVASGWECSIWFNVTSQQPVVLVLHQMAPIGPLIGEAKSDAMKVIDSPEDVSLFYLSPIMLLNTLGLATIIGRRRQV